MPLDGSTTIAPPTTVLIDRRNFEAMKSAIMELFRGTSLIGLDIETHDNDRHDGLNKFMNVNDEGFKAGNKKLVFDARRTTLCGLSIYPDGAQYAFYFNLGHLDVENRLTWGEVAEVLAAKEPGAKWVIHNAPFEWVMLRATTGWQLTDYICTLQMAVSAYGPDNYDINRFYQAPFEALRPLLGKAQTLFASYRHGEEKTTEQAELFAQIVGKESDASHSYNGLVDTIAWGYGLKRAVERWFGYKMTTFEECLGGKAHMGLITGEQCASYGAEDAFWAVKLYHRLLQHMLETNPQVVNTYFTQELPAVEVFGNMNFDGWRINLEAVEAKRHEERAETAKVLRRLRAAIIALLPFPLDLHEGMMKRESWYQGKKKDGSGGLKKRQQIIDWALLGDHPDDFTEVTRLGGSIAVGWLGRKVDKLLNLSYWQTARGLLYDLCQEKCIISQSKVQSDADARGKLVIRMEKRLRELKDEFSIADPEGKTEKEISRTKHKLEILHCLSALASIEQRSKLYIEPYLMLCDPDTGRVYPTISSKLATRRMAMETPNGQQLAKRGESVWVRGFFLADDDDELLVSEDWSNIELVSIGEQSGDPDFGRVFGQIPYEDLHLGAAADALHVIIPEMTEELLLGLDAMSTEQVDAINPRILMNRAGEQMAPGKAKKYWRTEVGKGSNFNYWYSGALSTVGERLGWTPDQMWAATEAYRNRFPVAEQWRVSTIDFVQRNGYIQLPDGHRRERFEATSYWVQAMRMKFAQFLHQHGPSEFFGDVLKAIQRRANNQAVNALIQGTCAALMKRTLARLHQEARATGWFRIVAPIHDEVVASVKRKHLHEYIRLSREIMCDHPALFKKLPLHCTVSVGRNFEPFDAKKAPFGQIELEEAPKVDWLPQEKWGKTLGENEIDRVLEYLMSAA